MERNELIAEVDALRRKRGEALSQGKNTAALDKDLARARNALEALDDAAAFNAEERRAAALLKKRQAEADRANRVAVLRRQIVADTKAAHVACNQFVGKVKAVLDGYFQLRKEYAEAESAVPAHFQDGEVRNRLALRFVSVLDALVPRSSHSFGVLHYTPHGSYNGMVPWDEAEQRGLDGGSPTNSTGIDSEKRKAARGE